MKPSIRSFLAVPWVLAGVVSCAGIEDGAVTTTMTAGEIARAPHARVCGSPTDEVHCHAHVLVDAAGNPVPHTTPAGLGPAQLRDAYKITSTGSSSTVIAIVDAFGYPNAESDLATYRSTFGLPPCTAASGCFRKVDQNGGGKLPAFDLGWAQESALDLDMASAICPGCRLLLVEAQSATFADLTTAVNEAAKLGAHVISNSYGASESGSTGFEPAYNHAGIAITASTGDSGFGVEFPASSPHVTAIGGTSLTAASNARGWTETAFGCGGCSAVYGKPPWQVDAFCTTRTVVDVAAVADPNTGVAVFAPTSRTQSVFLVFGGTSIGAPLIGGVYGVNGGPISFGSDPYANPGALFDITSGGSGTLCAARTGYDPPTGLGTPDGTAAF